MKKHIIFAILIGMSEVILSMNTQEKPFCFQTEVENAVGECFSEIPKALCSGSYKYGNENPSKPLPGRAFVTSTGIVSGSVLGCVLTCCNPVGCAIGFPVGGTCALIAHEQGRLDALYGTKK
ncbi:MAG: hypothetical protein ACXWL2_03705 [Candidatus Chromulinivorax sp.]